MTVKRRRAALAVITAVVALGLAPAAGATPPERGTFDFTESYTDTEVCAAAPWGFDVFVPVQHEFGFFRVFVDQQGNFVKAIVHNNYDATITANGKTITERDTWTSFFYPDGSRDVGLTVHIQGPGGIVVRDAGQIVRAADGTVLYTRGPHEQFSGVSFCPALAP
ncbi:MAG: hypothetical protein QOC68_1978 [Solirubrobacteraceae bacterium]|jgi:hypothetical protein|nr:hypothetical protein [Solirubrobacteraceae bacterium]